MENRATHKVDWKDVKLGRRQALRRPRLCIYYYGIMRSAETVVQYTHEPQWSRIGPDAEGDMHVNVNLMDAGGGEEGVGVSHCRPKGTH